MTSSLSKYILFFFLLLGIASVTNGQKLRRKRNKGKKFVEKLQRKRCKKEVCLAIECADSFIPDGECCPVCKAEPKPMLDCSAVTCAKCAGDENSLFVDGECCPKCEPMNLVDCSLMFCAQPPEPICSEGYEPVKEGCCGMTCKLKPNCMVLSEPNEPNEQIACTSLCPPVLCSDPCFSFSDTGEYVPKCTADQQCITKTAYISGGAYCPDIPCEEFIECEPKNLADCSLVLCAQPQEPVCSEGYEPVKEGCCGMTCKLKPNCVVVQCITEPCPPVCTEEVLLEPCITAACMNPCSLYSDTGEEVPKCTAEQKCVTEMVYISGGGDHCPATGCEEFVKCE